MMLSFMAAALLISVLSTDAQNHIPNRPPPPPGNPDYQSYDNPQVSDPNPDSFPASAQVSYSGPPNHIPNRPPPPPGNPDSQSYYNPQVSDPGNSGYTNNAHFGNPSPQYHPPPPWFPRNFGSPDCNDIGKLIALIVHKSRKCFERIMKGGMKKHWQRNQWHPGFPPFYPGPPQGYYGPYPGYNDPPQSYSATGTAQQPLLYPAQAFGSAIPPPSGTQQSNYGSPPNHVYNHHDSVPQQQPLSAAGADPSAPPNPQYSAGIPPFVPSPSVPVASVSSDDVKLPSNSILPTSGTPGNSS